MTKEFVQQRIAYLTSQKGISNSQISYELGHSQSYISNIVNGSALPSLEELFYMCEYFGITLPQFFDSDEAHPILTQKIVQNLYKINESDKQIIVAITDRLAEE